MRIRRVYNLKADIHGEMVMMLDRRTIKAIDKPFVITLLLILIFGLTVLMSASSAFSNPYQYVERQLIWIIIGMACVLLILNLDHAHLERSSRIFYFLALVLLVVVLIFGKEIRGSQGWISLGWVNLQVAEFAKILVILSFADFLHKRQGMLQNFWEIVPCFLYVGVPFLLVLLQPDLGTALAFIAIMMGMLFVAGANWRVLVGVLTVGLVGFLSLLYLHNHFGMWLPLEDYQIKRLTVFVDPYNDGMGGRGAGWNTIQSLVAVGSGGLFGKGLFRGTQVQLNFLPEQHTDFIFAVVGEELGFVGGGLLLFLFGLLILRSIYIAYNAKDFFSMLVVIGIVSMWIFHVFENIGMSIGLMPITGIPLPFVSYGGSFMLANMIAVGLILNINVKGRKIVF